MRDLKVLRYCQVSIEVTRPGELVATLLAEAGHSGAEIGSEQAGSSWNSGARSACLTSSPREVRGHGDRVNVREAIVETLQDAERRKVIVTSPIEDCLAQSCLGPILGFAW